MKPFHRLFLVLLAWTAVPELPAALAQEVPIKAFTGATLIDGTGRPAIGSAILLVQDGLVLEAGPIGQVAIPPEAEVVDLAGRYLMPGLVNTHGHTGNDPARVLALYARYGVTTVVSLGGEDEAHLALRDAQNRPDLARARIFVAGPVPNPASPAEAEAAVAHLARMSVDWVKIRVNPGGMPENVYQALIESAHRHALPVAAHMVTLADSKSLLRAGVDFLAHSVRDRELDEEFLALMRDTGVCLTPTLAREVSTFAYAGTPDFFSDPFFLREADPQTVERLRQPSAQRRAESGAARGRESLAMAQRNLKHLHDAGLPIAMGTDSGSPERFAGYFEHLELELMAQAGLPAEAILQAATGDAARCMKLDTELGTLEKGKWADFLVLREDPRADIRNTRSIESVWVAGNQVPGGGESGAQ